MREPVFTETMQVALVVATSRRRCDYVDDYGIGPWEIYEFNPDTVSDMEKDGEPAEYALRLALTMVGSVQWELIQPLDDKSIYAEFLADEGRGAPPRRRRRPSYGEALDALRAKGHRVLQSGIYNGVTFCLPLDRRGPRRDHRDLRLAAGPRRRSRTPSIRPLRNERRAGVATPPSCIGQTARAPATNQRRR